MPDRPIRIEPVAVWHDSGTGNGTIELTFTVLEVPPRPEWIREDQWYGGSLAAVSVSVPVGKKLNTSAPTGMGITGVVDGVQQFVKYTWNGTAWVNPIPCTSEGVPL